MTTDNLSAQKPFTIPAGTDFNGLVQPGTYQLLWYDATAQNTPTGGNACQLAVSRIAENVILQTCTVWRGGLVYETYQRIREDGTWTAWDKLAAEALQVAQAAQKTADSIQTARNSGNYKMTDIWTLSTPSQLWEAFDDTNRRLLLVHVDNAGGDLATKLSAVGANTGDFYCYFMGDGVQYGLLILTSPRHGLLATVGIWNNVWDYAVRVSYK